MPGHRDGVRVYWYPWERDSSGLFPSSQGACSPFPGRVFLRGPRSGPWGGPTSLGASSPSGNVLPRLTACRGSNFDSIFPKHLSNIRDHSVDEIRPRHTCWPSTPGQALSMPRPGTPAAQSRSLLGLRFMGLGLPRKTSASPRDYLWPRGLFNFVFKSSAKDSTHRAFGIALHGVPQGSSALGVSPTARASGGPGPLLLVGKRAAGARVASSPDSDLEAFSHNPTYGSFAPLAFQPSAMTNCANQRFLSY
ncbi:hypothetical protein HN873_060074 [Arachis hypogaea]